MKSRSRKAVSTASPSIDQEWRGRAAFETLQRAEEIKADKALMREVKRHAARAQQTTAKILHSAAGTTSRPRRNSTKEP